MSDDRTVVRTQHGGLTIAPGTRLNGIFEIERQVGSGGMGMVYRGRNIETGDAVAIKIVRAEMADNPQVLALFRKEAAVLHKLLHDAIVRYYLFTTDPGINRPYLATEFVDGIPLSDLIGQGPLARADVLALAERLADGLRAAHRLEIYHRDISPDNVILPAGDVRQAKIIDFGIARAATLGGGTVIGDSIAGKFDYMAPEQLGLYNKAVDARSDVYTLGIVLAEALLGRRLDMGGSQLEVIEKRRRVPDLSGIEPKLRAILASMLQPRPDDRIQSMDAVAAAVRALMQGSATVANTRRTGRRWAAAAMVLGVLAIFGAGAAVLLLQSPGEVLPDAPPPPVVANLDATLEPPTESRAGGIGIEGLPPDASPAGDRIGRTTAGSGDGGATEGFVANSGTADGTLPASGASVRETGGAAVAADIAPPDNRAPTGPSDDASAAAGGGVGADDRRGDVAAGTVGVAAEPPHDNAVGTAELPHDGGGRTAGVPRDNAVSQTAEPAVDKGGRPAEPPVEDGGRPEERSVEDGGRPAEPPVEEGGRAAEPPVENGGRTAERAAEDDGRPAKPPVGNGELPVEPPVANAAGPPVEPPVDNAKVGLDRASGAAELSSAPADSVDPGTTDTADGSNAALDRRPAERRSTDADQSDDNIVVAGVGPIVRDPVVPPEVSSDPRDHAPTTADGDATPPTATGAAVRTGPTTQVAPPTDSAAVERPETTSRADQAGAGTTGTASSELPATGATEPPATGAIELPATGATEPPATGATEPPATGATEPPATGATPPPATDATAPPAAVNRDTPAKIVLPADDLQAIDEGSTLNPVGKPGDGVLRYVRQYDAGPCTLLRPLRVGPETAVVAAFGTSLDQFRSFDADFRESNKFDARISISVVGAEQCPVLDFLSAIGTPGEGSLRMQIDTATVPSGGLLSGAITGLAQRDMLLFIAGNDGRLYGLNDMVSRRSDDATLHTTINGRGGRAEPHLVVAIAGKDVPYLTSGKPEPVVPALARLRSELAGKEPVETAVGYFMFGG